MPIPTTTIGSYPKPAYAPVPSPFDPETGAWRPMRPGERPPRDEAELDRAVREVVSEQVALGIDVPTDGEVRREGYILYHLRHLDGFDFNRPAHRVMRDGGWHAEVPRVTGPVRAQSPFLPQDWRVAQNATELPVKMTLPGPLTIVASTADEFYGDERVLAEALADALSVEVRALAKAGCQWIQIDEPVFAREPETALAFGIDLLERCFASVPDHVRRVVHICCGYPSAVDLEDYPKAEPTSYLKLADALDDAAVDAVSLEDAHRHNDLRLLERFSRTRVILGLVDIARSRVESAEEITSRLQKALEHIDPERLIAAPDCGLTMLPREIAVAKLTSLVVGARAVD